MLTATYALVALSVEQTSVRVSLQSFQHYMRSTLLGQSNITLTQLEYACASLQRLYQACHWRKLDMYLIPAIREATERADQLLDELGLLNQLALDAVRKLQGQMSSLTSSVADLRDGRVAQICDSIETFCTALLQRLEKEEQELFAIARRVIAGEVWFSIANQLMTHDRRVEEMRRAGAPARAAAVAAQPAARGPEKHTDELEDGAGADIAELAMLGMQVLPIIDIDNTAAPLAAKPAAAAAALAARPPRSARQDGALTK
jgi:hypothetical protein